MSQTDHTPVYLCSHIFENTHPVLLVIKEGGDIQLLCGGEHHQDEIPHVVGLGHMLLRDASLVSLLQNLQDDYGAERDSVASRWRVVSISG